MSKRWAHHTKSGGYDQLARRCGTTEVGRPSCSGFAMRTLRAAWRRLYVASPYLLDYRFEDFLAEVKTVLSARLRGVDIVHALYGDEHLNILLSARRLLPCPLVATFHLPSTRVVERFEKGQFEKLRRLDGAIVVSTAQLAAFRRWLGMDNVVFVPHGIDIHAFQPASSRPEREGLRLICVGHHMRDFAMVRRVADLCQNERLPVRFDIVTSQANFDHFAGCANATCRSGISEEDLISLYQAADALFMPVTDATANNAVLESLACGTPVITTDVGGMRDYLDSSCGWLLPCADTEATMNLIRCLARDKSSLIPRGHAARERAECFSWEHVVEQCRVAYTNLLSTGRIVGTSASLQENE